jgi:hypothetical protein
VPGTAVEAVADAMIEADFPCLKIWNWMRVFRCSASKKRIPMSHPSSSSALSAGPNLDSHLTPRNGRYIRPSNAFPFHSSRTFIRRVPR